MQLKGPGGSTAARQGRGPSAARLSCNQGVKSMRYLTQATHLLRRWAAARPAAFGVGAKASGVLRSEDIHTSTWAHGCVLNRR